jgi:hypothetical protein
VKSGDGLQVGWRDLPGGPAVGGDFEGGWHGFVTSFE